MYLWRKGLMFFSGLFWPPQKWESQIQIIIIYDTIYNLNGHWHSQKQWEWVHHLRTFTQKKYRKSRSNIENFSLSFYCWRESIIQCVWCPPYKGSLYFGHLLPFVDPRLEADLAKEIPLEKPLVAAALSSESTSSSIPRLPQRSTCHTSLPRTQ